MMNDGETLHPSSLSVGLVKIWMKRAGPVQEARMNDAEIQVLWKALEMLCCSGSLLGKSIPMRTNVVHSR